MHHHDVAIWVSGLGGLVGAGIAIFAGVWRAKHPGPQPFDFAASARRIRMRPIAPRGDA